MVTRSCAVLIALLATLLVPVTGPASQAAPVTFVHPGVGVSRPQLDFIRAKVQAGAQPWKMPSQDACVGRVRWRTRATSGYLNRPT